MLSTSVCFGVLPKFWALVFLDRVRIKQAQTSFNELKQKNIIFSSQMKFKNFCSASYEFKKNLFIFW